MDSPKSQVVAISLIVIFILAIWFINFLVVFNVFPSWAVRGQFGDLFGSVNALFSGLAFAGLIYTIFLQRRELALQREELKLQREEMAKSREELANQARVLELTFLATITQSKISALQTVVAAEEMDSLGRNPGTRQPYSDKIRKIAEDMNKLIDDLESKTGKV